MTKMEPLIRSRVLALLLVLIVSPATAFVSVQSKPGLPTSRPLPDAMIEKAYRPGSLPAAFTKSSSSSSTTKLCMWSNDEELRGTDRFKACVPYVLPLLDGDQFGHYIYQRIPPLGFLNDITIGPLADIYHSIPFLGIGLFVMLTLGTRFNTDMDRNVRFNAQQAALIDVALIFPELISSGFVEDPLPRYIAEPCANFVWYAYITAVMYSIVSNLRGRKPDQIPVISPWADLMVGPF